MRSKGTALVMCLCAVLLFTPAAFGQEQSGSIEGVVKDSSGGVLPGVTVEARSPQVVGVATTVTDAKGAYRFPALPPGRYVISATLEGFTPVKVNADLALGQLLKVELTMSIGGVQETVEVKGEAPLIDTKQNANFATIQKDVIDRIPKGRDFTTLLKQTTGTQDETRNGGVQVDGASGTENRFVIDGMDTTAMSDGGSGQRMMLDFIQEVQVKSSGYNAEFGGATGGVVSAITKSGSNTLHGSAGVYYWGNKNGFWIGDRRAYNRYDPYDSSKTIKDYKLPDTPSSTVNPIGDIGGPVFKDRLWYWAGLGYEKQSTSEDVTFYTDPNRVPRHFDWWDSSKYVNYNATTQLSNNLRIKFSGQNRRERTRGSAPALLWTNNVLPEGYVFPDGTVATTPYTNATFDMNADGSLNQSAFNSRWLEKGNGNCQPANCVGDITYDIYSANADWVVTPTFFVNASGGIYRTNRTTPPEWRGSDLQHLFGTGNEDASMIANGFPTVPLTYQRPVSYSDTPKTSAGTDRNLYQRLFLNANSTWFKNFKGQHTMKFGLRYERFSNDAFTGNLEPVVTLNWGQTATDANGNAAAGRYGYFTVNQQFTGGNVHSNNYALWLQDAWNLNARLTINAGVRAENEYLPAYNADLYPDAQSIGYGFGDKIAPRLGFAYDLKGDSKWKTYGSFGYYYTITPLQLARGSMGGEHWIDYIYTLDTYDWASITCEAGPQGCPGGRFLTSADMRPATNLVDPAASAYFGRPNMTGIDPGIKPVQTAEITGGMDHELSSIMSFGIRYVHKWAIRAQDDVGVMMPGGNEYYVLTNPGEGTFAAMEPSEPNVYESKPKRNYDSVEFKLRRRLANHWSAEASYVWSRLWGNWSGLTSSDEPSSQITTMAAGGGRTGSPDATRYWDNLIMSYDSKGHQVYGLLATDRTHVFKLSGTYDFKTGTTVGGFWFLESGTPQTTVMRLGQVTSGYSYPVYINGRNDLGRSPRLSQLDLQVSQDIRLGKTMRATAMLNVDNLFDQSTWTGLYNVSGYGPDPYRDGLLMQLPNAQLPLLQGYDPAALSAAYTGTHRVNQLYTTPNYFQGRRQVRVSFKCTF